ERASASMLARLLRLFGLGDVLLRFLGREAHLLDDRVRAGDDPAAVIAGLEVRHDRVADDDARHGIGQRRGRAIADLDPYLPLVGGNEQDHAIVLGFLPNAPGAAETVAVVLDWIALQTGHGGDDELPT